MNRIFIITNLLIAASLLVGVSPVFAQNSNNRVEVTQTAPLEISGGPCWEGVRFTSGFVHNNFRLIQLADGVQVTWTRQMDVGGGVGVVTGYSYEAKENFNYVFHLQKGQYVLPQRLFFRLKQTNTGKVFTVKQQSVLMYDPATNVVKVVVDSYEVGCP